MYIKWGKSAKWKLSLKESTGIVTLKESTVIVTLYSGQGGHSTVIVTREKGNRVETKNSNP